MVGVDCDRARPLGGWPGSQVTRWQEGRLQSPLLQVQCQPVTLAMGRGFGILGGPHPVWGYRCSAPEDALKKQNCRPPLPPMKNEFRWDLPLVCPSVLRVPLRREDPPSSQEGP